MTNHVPTLETCQRLKEAGFPQSIYSNWYRSQHRTGINDSVLSREQVREVSRRGIRLEFLCAAPLLTEILEQLPKYIGDIESRKNILVSYDYDEWFIGYLGDNESRADIYARNNNPAEAAALLWLELNEKG